MSFTYDYPHPAVTADIVVFSIIDNQLKVTLIERALEPYKGHWALPGGFVHMDEDLERGARRELVEETNVTEEQLEGLPFLQAGVYGSPDRDPRERVITVSFLTFVPSNRIELSASSDAAKAEWFTLDDLPPLAFDHATILEDARNRLSEIVSTNISKDAAAVFSFLPEEFTLAEAQAVFEIVKGETLDKRNFRKWISFHWELVDLNKKKVGGRHRPAGLFKFLKQK